MTYTEIAIRQSIGSLYTVKGD